MSDSAEPTSQRVPVTVLTGFLGSGKTTLLNHILTAQHGQRIAVIENEFGEIGIDHELVIHADEEIFEMNNGCICCTVRGDLIRILGQLLKRRTKFDRILIETTGLADPGPVAQTFFMDDQLQSKLELDGVVTLVDALHVEQQLANAPEANGQIAFADVILLNKTDLVSAEELTSVQARLQKMNARAKIIPTQMAQTSLEAVLNVGGFDLKRALEVDPQFMEPEYPFEWGGVLDFDPEGQPASLQLQEGPDETMKIAFFGIDTSNLQDIAEQAVRIFALDEEAATSNQVLEPGFYNLKLTPAPTTFQLKAPKAGRYALVCEHHPDEFSTQFVGLKVEESRHYKPDHEHDDEVSSVGVKIDGNLDQQRFRDWLGQLLREKGTDIYRMKGIVALEGIEERFVFQGVHMLFDGKPDRPWGTQERECQMIFIGRNLDRHELTSGLEACRA